MFYYDPLSTEFTTTIHYLRPSAIPKFANLGQWHPRRIGCLWPLQQLSDNILRSKREEPGNGHDEVPFVTLQLAGYWFSYSATFNHHMGYIQF